MALLTSLANIQSIAKDDASIQALLVTDDEVILALADVALLVSETIFFTRTELAQRYLGAHLLSLASQPVGGRGPLSSVNLGGVSRSYTLPYLNQKTVLGSTQYGLMFMEIRDSVIIPFYNHIVT